MFTFTHKFAVVLIALIVIALANVNGIESGSGNGIEDGSISRRLLSLSASLSDYESLSSSDTDMPTASPTLGPTTAAPTTASPTTAAPTTASPTATPTATPTITPTTTPTASPI
eukprot:CAMPEP_0197048256 /NCGR_PEP_ID=MMETSP1384-20130603/23652_1 /TAXON_ID=29189 /ORGANISM="Ammonia sp." /LENGTH=113 /DNA_ID=CAMNT_0042480367 /DNA_START=105 /DNA_END=446 /DNA_ORIENTATION=+